MCDQINIFHKNSFVSISARWTHKLLTCLLVYVNICILKYLCLLDALFIFLHTFIFSQLIRTLLNVLYLYVCSIFNAWSFSLSLYVCFLVLCVRVIDYEYFDVLFRVISCPNEMTLTDVILNLIFVQFWAKNHFLNAKKSFLTPTANSKFWFKSPRMNVRVWPEKHFLSRKMISDQTSWS